MQDITSAYNLNVTGFSPSINQFVTQQKAAYVPGTTHAGSNQVVGFQSVGFTSNYDAVVLDQDRSHYAIQVTSAGVTTITDINGSDATFGQSVVVTGESYIVFNGASAQSITVNNIQYPIYDQMYFVQSAANAQVAEFYAAILQRQPDLGGLEYWETQAASGGILNVAANFLSVIHTSYSGSTPLTTLGGDPATMTNTQFITAPLFQPFGPCPG